MRQIDASQLEDAVTAKCPECQNTGDVPEWWTGLEIECKECDERFTVTGRGSDE